MKNTIYFTLLFLSSWANFAQPIKISSIVSENKITSFANNKLILIDFWATWCAPCVSATKQLEILQKNNSDIFFMIAISDEHPTKIEKYLEKRTIEAMVVADFQNYTFSKYTVQSRPSMVLLNPKGDLLWQGHPGNFTQKILLEFYASENKNFKNATFEDVIVLEKEKVEKTTFLENNDAIILKSTLDQNDAFTITSNEVHFTGDIKNLYEYLSTNYTYQVEIDPTINEYVHLICSEATWKNNKEKILKTLLETFQLEEKAYSKKMEIEEISIENKQLLWDTNQLDWGENAAKFLVGNDRIQADNMTIAAICNLISKVKNKKYYFDSTTITQEFDWDFHFLYDDLMLEDLNSSFGIAIKTKAKILPVIQITKKTE